MRAEGGGTGIGLAAHVAGVAVVVVATVEGEVGPVGGVPALVGVVGIGRVDDVGLRLEQLGGGGGGRSRDGRNAVLHRGRVVSRHDDRVGLAGAHHGVL